MLNDLKRYCEGMETNQKQSGSGAAGSRLRTIVLASAMAAGAVFLPALRGAVPLTRLQIKMQRQRFRSTLMAMLVQAMSNHR